MMFDVQMWSDLFYGAIVSARIAFAAILIGIPIGLLVALLRIAKIPVINQVLALYISVIRMTPLITLLLFFFLTVNGLGISINREVTAILALVINTTTFNSEIWRLSIESFSKEQREAALTVGMTNSTIYRRIIIPQALISSLPGLVSEATMVVKVTPAIAVIGLVDLTQATRRIAVVTFDPFTPLLVAMFMYLIIISLLTRVQKRLEKNANRLAI